MREQTQTDYWQNVAWRILETDGAVAHDWLVGVAKQMEGLDTLRAEQIRLEDALKIRDDYWEIRQEVALYLRENQELKAEQTRLREALEGWERKARVILWARHGCPSRYKYGDDGELQCSNVAAHPGVVDFKRTPIDEIEGALMTATLAALSSTPTPETTP